MKKTIIIISLLVSFVVSQVKADKPYINPEIKILTDLRNSISDVQPEKALETVQLMQKLRAQKANIGWTRSDESDLGFNEDMTENIATKLAVAREANAVALMGKWEAVLKVMKSMRADMLEQKRSAR